jgi:hypothetical protein
VTTELSSANKSGGRGAEAEASGARVEAAVVAAPDDVLVVDEATGREVVCTEDLSIGSIVTCVTEITLGPSRRVRVMETAGEPVALGVPALEVAILIDRDAREGDAFVLPFLLETREPAVAVVGGVGRGASVVGKAPVTPCNMELIRSATVPPLACPLLRRAVPSLAAEVAGALCRPDASSGAASVGARSSRRLRCREEHGKNGS